jgi:hypothetical protein
MLDSALVLKAREFGHTLFMLDELVIAHPLFQHISKKSVHLLGFLNKKQFTTLVASSFFFTVAYSYKNWFLTNTRKKLIFFLVFFVVGIALNVFIFKQL